MILNDIIFLIIGSILVFILMMAFRLLFNEFEKGWYDKK